MDRGSGLLAPLLLSLSAIAIGVAVCLGKRKSEMPHKSAKSQKQVGLAEETSTNKTPCESSQHQQVHLMDSPALRSKDDYAVRRVVHAGRKNNRTSVTGNRHVSHRTANNTVSHTAKRTPSTATSTKGVPSYTDKTSKRNTKQDLMRRKSADKRRAKKEKKKPVKRRLDLSDATKSETSERMRYRMTFPEDPYDVRVPSYTAPDGRVITPKEQIAIRREFRQATEYPTMDDVKSMWETIEDKEGEGRERTSSKKKKVMPKSSDTMPTSDGPVIAFEDAKLTPQPSGGAEDR